MAAKLNRVAFIALTLVTLTAQSLFLGASQANAAGTCSYNVTAPYESPSSTINYGGSQVCRPSGGAVLYQHRARIRLQREKVNLGPLPNTWSTVATRYTPYANSGSTSSGYWDYSCSAFGRHEGRTQQTGYIQASDYTGYVQTYTSYGVELC